MAIAEVKLFLEKVQEDHELREQLMGLQGQDKESQLQGIFQLAKANGFDFSMEDFAQFPVRQTAEQELNEHQLEAVAGGVIDYIAAIFYSIKDLFEGEDINYCLG